MLGYQWRKTSSRSWRMRYGRRRRQGRQGTLQRHGLIWLIGLTGLNGLIGPDFADWANWADWDRNQTFKKVLKSESYKNWNYQSLTESPDPILEMLAHLRGCSHITSAKIRGSWTPPPPSVSNGQHLAYPPSPPRQQWSAFGLPPLPPSSAFVSICSTPPLYYNFFS